jgi:hypothetical protein
VILQLVAPLLLLVGLLVRLLVVVVVEEELVQEILDGTVKFCANVKSAH